MNLRDCFFKDDEFSAAPRMGWRSALRSYWLDPAYSVRCRYRLMEFFRSRSHQFRWFALLSARMRYRLSLYCGVEMNNVIPAGWGLRFAHPHDIVIGRYAEIGSQVVLYNGVTLGAKKVGDADRDAYPKIGDRVVIFTGAKLIGNIVIGSDSIVGANAVVLESFPSGSIIAGVPAKLVGTVFPKM